MRKLKFKCFSIRCICPGETFGRACKFTSMTVSPGGFAWLDPLPSCFPLTLSLQFTALSNHGILLYSGPLGEKGPWSSTQENIKRSFASPLLVLQLIHGRLQLLLEGVMGSHKLELRIPSIGSDGHRYYVYLFLDNNVSRIPVIYIFFNSSCVCKRHNLLKFILTYQPT